MLAGLRSCDPTQPLWRTAFYRLCRKIIAVYVRTCYRVRIRGAKNIPPTGPVLVVSNHQSHLDPPLVGVALGHRNMASIAREGLFKVPVFGLVLRALGAISIRQNEGDTGAMRAAIGELKKGRLMLIFPEGSRSPDGAVHEFKRGAWLLMTRAGCDILPAAVEGAFDAWPRDRKFPRLLGCRCAVAFGQPISHAQLKDLGADAGLEFLAQRIDQMRLELRHELREATGGRLPEAGAGDSPRQTTTPTQEAVR